MRVIMDGQAEGPVVLLSRLRDEATKDPHPMRSKFTLQALALTGILAVSGLPAFAADVTPTSPLLPAVNAPSASVSSDSNAKLGTGTSASVGTSAKASATQSKAAATKKVEKTKAATVKKTSKTATAAKTQVHQQTAQRPAAPAGVDSSAKVNGSVGTSSDAVGTNGSVGATTH